MKIANRLMAAVLGLLLAILGGIVLLEAALALLDRSPLLVSRTSISSAFRELSWSDPSILITAIGLLIAGVLLLVLQLWPRWPDELTVTATEQRTVLVDRRAVAARLADEAGRDAQVRQSDARVRRHSAKVAVVADPGTDTDRLGRRVREDTEALVARLDLKRPLKTKVAISQARERKQ